MRAAANRHVDAEVSCCIDRSDHVRDVDASCDQPRAFVDHRVEELSGFVVVNVAGPDHPSAHPGQRFTEVGLGANALSHVSLLLPALSVNLALSRSSY